MDIHTILVKGLNFTKRIYGRLFSPLDDNSLTLNNVLDKKEASQQIKAILLNDKPAFIGRLGHGELSAVANFLSIQNDSNLFIKSYEYIVNKSKPFWWDDQIKTAMAFNAGFFSSHPLAFEKFSLMMLKDMTQVDILGSWLSDERFFTDYLKNAIKVRLPDLEPYYHEDPWSEVLANKKVLVIHPFDKSIESQYLKRELLFEDKRILPKFDLITFQAVQSIANNKTEFLDWFEAFDYMCEKISQIEFDIAIIGCGAYGFPLGAFIKRMGKKAVHLGGATQILFGIKGKRWEDISAVSNLFNKYWVNPLPTEIPQNFKKVEGGCYW